MKKIIFLVSMAFAFMAVNAQESYIVKTSNVKKSVSATPVKTSVELQTDEQEPQDFVGQNFKYRSLCNWTEGMKFMVMPERYDMIVNTFRDAATDKEVSSSRLRHKIMVYKNHTVELDDSERINFQCLDDNKYYYYEIPSGTFDDYCYGKLGVPTLAYLGDVDIAREKLKDATLYTTTNLYRIDTETEGDGFETVNVAKNTKVKVKAIGVGSRSFPVKIIVEDAKGNEFYQNVAISKTNSGMRDDEFGKDNVRYTFYGSFRLADQNIATSKEYQKYLNRVVHTRYATKMHNVKGEYVNILRLSTFEITNIEAQSNTNYVLMTVKSQRTGEVFTKQVTFVNENVAGDVDGQKEDYYGYLFKEGAPNFKGISDKDRELIHQGKIRKGFSRDAVRMALGEPSHTESSSNGYCWVYNYDGQPRRMVYFSLGDKVTGFKRLR